jgi:hypothetical protein
MVCIEKDKNTRAGALRPIPRTEHHCVGCALQFTTTVPVLRQVIDYAYMGIFPIICASVLRVINPLGGGQNSHVPEKPRFEAAPFQPKRLSKATMP